MPITLKCDRNVVKESGHGHLFLIFMLSAVLSYTLEQINFYLNLPSPKQKKTEKGEGRKKRRTKAHVANWWYSQHFEHRKDVSHMW